MTGCSGARLWACAANSAFLATIRPLCQLHCRVLQGKGDRRRLAAVGGRLEMRFQNVLHGNPRVRQQPVGGLLFRPLRKDDRQVLPHVLHLGPAHVNDSPRHLPVGVARPPVLPLRPVRVRAIEGRASPKGGGRSRDVCSPRPRSLPTAPSRRPAGMRCENCRSRAGGRKGGRRDPPRIVPPSGSCPPPRSGARRGGRTFDGSVEGVVAHHSIPNLSFASGVFAQGSPGI